MGEWIEKLNFLGNSTTAHTSVHTDRIGKSGKWFKGNELEMIGDCAKDCQGGKAARKEFVSA